MYSNYSITNDASTTSKNSMIFKTKNNELAIFGKTLDDVKNKYTNFVTALNTNGLKGENGALNILFGSKNNRESILSPELLDDFETFKDLFNNSSMSAEALAESLGGVDERIINYAKTCKNGELTTKGFTTSLEGMTLSAKAGQVALKGLALVGNMLASYLLTKVITAYSDYKNKIHEIADESSKQASQSSEYVTKLNDLQKELKNGTKSSDELTSAFKEQLLTMGYTESEIDNLIAKYNGLAGAISAATEEALKNARKDAYVDVASTSKALEVDSNGGFINDILIEKKTTGIKELDKQINELMSDYATFSADGGNKWIPKDSSAEGLYNYYNSLKKVSELIQDTASQTNNNDLLNQGNFFNHTLLGEVTDAIDKMKDSAEAYGSAIERLHSVDAQLELSNYLKTNDINSQDSFDSYVKSIKDNTSYSEEYKNVLLDLVNNTFPQFVESIDTVSDAISSIKETSISLPDLDTLRTQINGTSDDTTNLADELKLVQEVLQSTGQISEETYTKLLKCSSKYSSAVKTENGRLTINKSKLKATALMRSNETKKTIQQVKAQKQLEYLKKAKELNIYNNTLLDTTSETYDNVTALQNQITQLSMLTEQLNTATDAFQNFKDAQSSDDLNMYNTSSDAFKTIKDALESGQVGSDDMRAAMELLMSQDQYKEFLKAGHSEEDALEKQYLFMEKWADTNKKFFGDDMKQNAINFFEYLDKTGLLADGVLATSEEIGKQTGLSVDAVNSLIQFGNMYGFQDIIQQSQIDYVDDYVEKMQNLQSAKEAFQQANESDPNSNITLGLKDDLSNAQKELDDFYADIPKKFNDISEEYMNTTTDKSLGEYFTEQMGGDDNTLAYMQSIGDRLKYIDQEKNRLSVQNKDKGIFSTSQYKALEDEESVLKSIQEQLETSNDTYQKAIANTDEYVKLVAKKKSIQKAMSQSGSDSEIKQLSGELSEIQGQLDALSAPTQIQLSLD